MKVKLIIKDKDPWSGFKGTLYPNCKHHVAPYLTRSGNVYTGMKDKIEQEHWEKLLQKDLRTKIEGKDNLFWLNFKISVGEDGVNFDTDNDWEAFLVNFCKNHKNVSNGYNDRKPSTEFILIEEQATAEEANKKTQIKIKAMVEYNKMTVEQMKKALRVYGYNAASATNEIVQNVLFGYIEEDPSKFLRIWVDNKDKDVLYLIEEAVAHNVIRKNKTIYKYGSDVLGYTLEDTIDYLKNPGNSTIRLTIQTLLEGGKEVEQPLEVRSEGMGEYKKLLEEVEKEETLKNIVLTTKETDDRNVASETPINLTPKKKKI
jgi:hypothetical protein